MKIKYTSLLALILIINFTSCKKNQEDTLVEDPKVKIINKTSTVPGQGYLQSYIQDQADGTSVVGWGGITIKFGHITHKTVGFYDGEQVVDMLIIDGNPQQYISINTIGPFFILILPTYVGSIAPTREQIKAFENAYEDFIGHKRDVYGGLLQAYMPNLEDYVNLDQSGQIIVTGQVVMSHSSPSKVSVVPANFVAPTQPAPMLTLLPEIYVRNGINYDLAGNDNGQIAEVIATNAATNTRVPIYGFSGDYILGNPTTVQNLRIYTSPTEYFEYSGPLTN